MFKISIIIPVYNAEKYLKRCLDSVINQTYNNIEIICINDCSTDNTLKVLEGYGQIKVFSTPVNSRQGAARNVGLDNCTGDYILFVDSDDTLYDSDVLSKIADKIKNSNYPDIVYLGFKMVGKREFELIPDQENTTKEYRLAENSFINVFSICWKNILIFKEEYYESFNVWMGISSSYFRRFGNSQLWFDKRYVSTGGYGYYILYS